MAKRKVNYLMGALKRKYKLGKGDVEPGTFINKLMQSQKETTESANGLSKEKVSIMGLV